MLEATMYSGGRELRLTGTHPEYLAGLNGSNADQSLIVQVTKDLPRGSACFDVGANIGVTAISMAAHRPDLRIVAFEPVPDNARCLRRNIEVNRITNIEVVEVAVSNSHGLIPMGNNGPYSSFDPASSLKCKSIPLDDYAQIPVAFVKVDTEGFEPHVFDGAREVFLRHRPLVLAEFNSWWLLVHGYNPILFSGAIFRACEVLGMYHLDAPSELPKDAVDIAYQNIMKHKCVTDVLVRPRAPFPSFREMVGPIL